MSVRLLLTEEAWTEIASILTAIKSRAGSPPVLSHRMFIEAVLYLARTGTPWRDLPEAFGHWDAVYNRLRRWERRGLWRPLWERRQTEAWPLRARSKKRRPRRTGFGPLSGRLVHHNPGWLSR